MALCFLPWYNHRTVKNGEGQGNNVLVPTVFMAVVAGLLFLIAYFRGQGEHILGLKMGMSLLVRILPLLVFALAVSGLVQVLVPREIIVQWVGPESGLKGVLVGTIAGFLTPGGPFVVFPIAAGFIASGAAIGTMVSYVTAWALGALSRLPIEVGILGIKFTLLHLASTFFFPPIAGLVANWITRIFPL